MMEKIKNAYWNFRSPAMVLLVLLVVLIGCAIGLVVDELSLDPLFRGKYNFGRERTAIAAEALEAAKAAGDDDMAFRIDACYRDGAENEFLSYDYSRISVDVETGVEYVTGGRGSYTVRIDADGNPMMSPEWEAYMAVINQ